MTRFSPGVPAVVTTAIAVACSGESPDGARDHVAAAEPTVVASGLNRPMGVLVEPDGTLWVVDSGVGGDTVFETMDFASRQPTEGSWGVTSRVIRVDSAGTQSVVAHLPSVAVGGIVYGGAHPVILDGVLYITSGGWIEGMPESDPTHSGIVRVDAGAVTAIVDTREIERTRNPDSANIESNPWGLAIGPDRKLWMTDAAGNTVYRVDVNGGTLELVAVLAVMPGEVPNRARGGALEVEPVPTAIAFMNGDAYVALLPGAPMARGAAKVVRLLPDGTTTDYATGLTRLTDLETGPDGQLYAVSIGNGGEGPTGSVLRIRPGTASEPLLTGLSFPTAIAFDDAGHAYVTINGLGAPGSGEVFRYEGLARGPR